MDQDPNREPEVKSLMYQFCAFTRVFEVAIIKSKLTQESDCCTAAEHTPRTYEVVSSNPTRH